MSAHKAVDGRDKPGHDVEIFATKLLLRRTGFPAFAGHDRERVVVPLRPPLQQSHPSHAIVTPRDRHHLYALHRSIRDLTMILRSLILSVALALGISAARAETAVKLPLPATDVAVSDGEQVA